jgi:hypothetical protein
MEPTCSEILYLRVCVYQNIWVSYYEYFSIQCSKSNSKLNFFKLNIAIYLGFVSKQILH